ncbi:MAG: NapC/NirT family cytochrome c [Spirochaetota bacterium]
MAEKKKMSMGKKLTLVAVGVVLFGAIAFAGIELTCTSWFCLSCHEMKELGAAWKLSKHGPDNPEMHNCMKCHSQPGLLGLLKAKIAGLFSLVYHLTGDYHLEATQPVVCVRSECHHIEDLDRATRPDQTVTLSHAKHIKVMKSIGTRYQCMPCHRDIAHGEQKFLPDMKTSCFLCHTNQDIAASNCALCHPKHPAVRLTDDETPILEYHQDVKCVECHTEACKATKATCDTCHEGENYGDRVVYKGKAMK